MNSRIRVGALVPVIAIALGIGMASPGIARTGGPTEAGRAKVVTETFDVATDATTFRIAGGKSLPEALRGDTFIVEGKIYAAETIPPGGSLDAPGAFDPATAGGSIGTWVLRGTLNRDFTEIIGGSSPFVYGTQYFVFDDGRLLVSDGAHGGPPVTRSVVGGGGAFAGASGEVVEQIIGVNATGLFNQRFTFHIKRQSIK